MRKNQKSGVLMERNFEYLVAKYGEAGAREIFEKICVSLLQCQHGPKAKTVKPSQGDGGIDVLVGDIPEIEKVYQCKFFLEKLEDSQKQQIRKSFKTVNEKYDVSEWYLCLPTVLTEKELLWWSKWKNEKEIETGVKIELCDGSYLINNLKKHELYTQVFDDDLRIQLDAILSELITQRQKVMEEILYGIDDIENLEEEYNDFIFVKMLESANVTGINDCKVEFFNAEISRQESISKDEVAGIRVYNNLKSKIFSLWQTQYREHKHPFDGNNLLNKMYTRVEDLDSTTLASTNEYTLLSKKGILHHLANDKKIGWIEDYMTKLIEYMENR